MQLSVLGRRALVLLSVALGGACAQTAPAPVLPVVPAVRHAAPALTPAAVVACPLGNVGTVWLPGAEQLLSFCDTTIELRDAVSGFVRAQKATSRPGRLGEGIRSAIVSPDGRRVALLRSQLEVRELPTLNLVWSADIRPNALGFSGDGQLLRVQDDTTMVGFSVADGQRVDAALPNVAKRWQDAPELSADDSLAFEVKDTEITVWDAHKDVALRSFERPKGASWALTWIGPYLALQVSDGYLLVDARDPQRRFSLKGPRDLGQAELSKDGTRLRSLNQGALLEWRLGEALPAVLAAPAPTQVWLGPVGVRVESTGDTLTVWRQTPAGGRIAHCYFARARWVEFGPAGEVVVRDAAQPRLLFQTDATARDVALAPDDDADTLAFEPGGARFVTATRGRLHVYQAQTLTVQQTIELPFAAVLAWRSEPPELLFVDAERLYGVALASGKVTPLGDFGRVLHFAVSSDGKQVAVAAVRGKEFELALLSPAGIQHEPLLSLPREIRFSPDGKAVWVLEEYSLLTVRLPVSTSTTEPAKRRPLKSGGYQPSLAPNGDVYSVSNRLRFATENGDMVAEAQPVALQPAWSAQGLTLTSELNRQASTVISFPAGTVVQQQLPRTAPKAAEMPELPLTSGDVRGWALNADHSVLATLDGNNTVNTFSTTGGLRARLAESASALVSSDDASSLVVVAADTRSLTLWDTNTWQPRVELPVAERINQLALSKDGARLAVLDDNGALQVVFADRSLHRYALRQDMATRGLAFDPSSQFLALGGLPLRILRLADGALLYGYTATTEPKDPIVVAWVSESGAVQGDLRALSAFTFPSPTTAGAVLDTATFAKQQAPHLLVDFFKAN
jgi:WD40 repeat protein